MSGNGSITALAYEFGVTRYFGQSDIDSRGLLHGWSMSEDAHVWNDGPDASLRLLTQKLSSACRITVEGEPFIDRAVPRQEMTLFVNGFRIGFWRITEPRPYILSAILYPEQIFERSGKSLLSITWFIPTSARPVELGIGSDNRELGFCFRSLTIGEDTKLL